jgi:aryl carrier-like protein
VANARRELLRGEAADLHQFVASLEVTTTFHPPTRENLARAAQLTQRTNQFNTTTLRRSEAELAALRERGAELLIVDVSDRFGDYGIVGLVSYQRRPGGQASEATEEATGEATGEQGGSLEVDSLLLSCRALGRGVEQRILATLGRLAEASGLARVEIAYRQTAKNQPVHQFLEAIARRHRVAIGAEADRHFSYRIPVAEALAATDKLAAIEIAEERAGRDAAPTPAPAEVEGAHQLWPTILRELDTVAKIRRAIPSALARSRVASGSFVAPRDELEQAIARIWCEVLLVEQVGLHDDYFAIGGDSIRSLAVVAAMRQAHLPVTVIELHEHPSIGQLAEEIRRRGAVLAPVATPDPGDRSSSGADGPYPLSFSQRYVVETYARHNLQPGTPPTGVFHTQDRISVRAQRHRPSMEALRRAVAGLVRRTSTLRTRIFQSAAGWQQLELEAYPSVLEILDVSQLDPAQQQAELDRLLVEDRSRPFDPEHSGAALIRCYAVVTGEETFELIVTTHHGFCDGWSMQAAYNQLFALYEAHASGDDARVAELDRAMAAGDGAFRELVVREQAELAASTTVERWRTPLPSRGQAPGRGPKQTLIATADWQLFANASERARTSHTSAKAVLLDALATALATQRTTPWPLVLAVVTNGRRDDLTRPMDVFGLCWTLVPIVIAAERMPPVAAVDRLEALHQELLSAEAHARTPLQTMFQGRDPEAVAFASFNLTNFHNSSWQSGTTHLQLTKREPFHRFPFALDFNVRLHERSRTVVLKVSWAQGACDEAAARTLLDDFASALAAPPLRGE